MGFEGCLLLLRGILFVGFCGFYSQADFSTVRNRRAYLAGAASFSCSRSRQGVLVS